VKYVFVGQHSENVVNDSFVLNISNDSLRSDPVTFGVNQKLFAWLNYRYTINAVPTLIEQN
jgi:hypothetical protein